MLQKEHFADQLKMKVLLNQKCAALVAACVLWLEIW